MHCVTLDRKHQIKASTAKRKWRIKKDKVEKDSVCVLCVVIQREGFSQHVSMAYSNWLNSLVYLLFTDTNNKTNLFEVFTRL